MPATTNARIAIPTAVQAATVLPWLSDMQGSSTGGCGRRGQSSGRRAGQRVVGSCPSSIAFQSSRLLASSPSRSTSAGVRLAGGRVVAGAHLGPVAAPGGRRARWRPRQHGGDQRTSSTSRRGAGRGGTAGRDLRADDGGPEHRAGSAGRATRPRPSTVSTRRIQRRVTSSDAPRGEQQQRHGAGQREPVGRLSHGRPSTRSAGARRDVTHGLLPASAASAGRGEPEQHHRPEAVRRGAASATEADRRRSRCGCRCGRPGPPGRRVTSRVSPSQSSRTSLTHCRLPEVSPLTQYSWRERLQNVVRPVVSVRCSASSSIQPSISTSPVSCCCTTAGTRPSPSRLRRCGDRRGRAGLVIDSSIPALTGRRSARLGAGLTAWLGDPGRVQPAVDATLGDQPVVRPALHDPALVEDDHLVGVLGGGQPVGDGDRGAAVHQRLQRPADAHLELGVDRAGGLVEHQQVGVGEVRPDQRDQLSLARAHRLAALADPGVEAHRQRLPASRRGRAR